ncbi:kelch-like protein 11 isoform X2 [Dreissena polymorpha]|uniref:BTB domain-containing protein n=1 Tax=Dreissena polymorpha TaxID=45954 RepID=A0A9D4K808_DREPO|nr:kelch-like protein 11 isoform X2 [Dreissena polymorpha]KAH3834634.1 hypothetical protein DPMN_107966 [Dreissena polymorpha]
MKTSRLLTMDYGGQETLPSASTDGLIQVRNEDGPIVLDHLIQELKAHWSVLRKYPFFEGLYTSGMKERQEGRVNIGIGESEAVWEILRYMYTSQISLMRSNIQDVLELADYLQLDRLRTMCFNYLRRNVSPLTCVLHLSLATRYTADIYDELLMYFWGHIPQVLRTQDALELPLDILRKVVKKPCLSYASRAMLFQFLVRWVEHCPKERETYFESMFCSLDLSKMGYLFCKDYVETCKYVQNSNTCKQWYEKSDQSIQTSCEANAIIILGGLDKNSSGTREVFVYLLDEQRWVRIADIPWEIETPSLTYNASTNCLHVFDRLYGTCLDETTRYNIKCYKFSFGMNEWSSDELFISKSASESFTISKIKDVLFLNATGNCCVVAMCKDKTNPKASQVCLSIGNHSSHNPFKVICSDVGSDIQTCIVKDRYVCIIVLVLPTQGHYEKLDCRDLHLLLLDTMVECEVSIERYSIAPCYSSLDAIKCFALNDCVYITIPNITDNIFESYGHRFDVQERKWCEFKFPQLKSNCVPILPRYYGYTTVRNTIYIFGGKQHTSNIVKRVYKLDMKLKRCHKMQPMPAHRYHCKAISACILSNVCHKECPHCKYSPKPTRT